MNSLTIRKTVIFGFSLILALLVVIVGKALIDQSEIRTTVNTVITSNQPAMVKSLELAAKVNHTSTALGMYLLSKDESHKIAFIDNLTTIQNDLQEFSSIKGIATDDVSRGIINTINDDVIKFASFKDKLLQLANSPEENLPAVSYAAKKVNPLNRKILQLMTKLADVEQEYELSRNHEVIINDINSLRFSWENMISNMQAYLIYRDKTSLKEVGNYKSLIINLIKQIKAQESSLSSSGKTQLSRITKYINKVTVHVDHVIEVHSGENWRLDAQLIRDKIEPILVSMKVKLNKLIFIQQDKINSSSDTLLSQLKQSHFILLLSIVAGIIFVVFISKLTLSKIMHMIVKLRIALHKLADGDLSYRMEIIGDGEFAIIANEFNKFAKEIQSIINEITSVSSNLIDTSAQMSAAAEQASSSAGQQKDDSEESARSIQEMSICVQDVAKNAVEAANEANIAENEAAKGEQVVNQTIQVINTLANEVNKATSAMDELKEDTESIGTILDVIKSIADQTNLLALNAAIEAARAGEQGRGFAVVADEVRTLASRTQQSTQEIHTMIDKLQLGSENAVQVMQQGSKQAEASVQHSANAGDALQSIMKAVSNIKQMNDQIATAAEEQSVVSENINMNITNINQRTEKSVDRRDCN